MILPLLRCPVTGGVLSLANNNQELVSENGKQRWSMLEGVPVLYPGMDEPRIVDDFHLSNALPDSALQLIQSTPGAVLHLRAGGSAKTI